MQPLRVTLTLADVYSFDILKRVMDTCAWEAEIIQARLKSKSAPWAGTDNTPSRVSFVGHGDDWRDR